MSELPAGRLVGLFGIRGELKCDPSSAGRTLFVRGAKFTAVCQDGARVDVRVATTREHKGRPLVTIEGYDDGTAAEKLVGATLYASRERLEAELDDDEYLDDDLIGCTLYDPAGTALGVVTDVRHYPSSDMLVVNDRLVPMVRAFMQQIDIEAKKIVAELPPGLLDDDATEA